MNGNTDNIPAQESAREYYTHQQLRLSEESDMDLQRDTHDGLIMPDWAPQGTKAFLGQSRHPWKPWGTTRQ